MIEKGQWWEFGQDTRVTPLLFKRSAMGFLITTESQHLGHFTSRITHYFNKKKICKALLHKATKYTIELHFPCLIYIYIYIYI